MNACISSQNGFDPSTGLGSVLCTVYDLISLLLPIVMVLALLYFFWGLANYILSAGDDGKKEEGRNIMIWGSITLFVMVSIWGIIALIQDTFGTYGDGPVPTVTLPK